MDFRPILLVFVLSLAGCASAGVQVDQRTVETFVKGRTTLGDVIAALGQPTSSTITSEGRRIIIYTYAQVQARPESFIPYVGLFVGGVDTKSSSASFVFDRQGILQDYSSTSGQIGAGTGLESDTPFNDRVLDQPRPNSAAIVASTTPSQNRLDLGLSGTTVTSSSTAAVYMSDPHGVFVASVTRDGPAAKSGIQAGDIIITFGGLRVDTLDELAGIVSTTAPGSVVKLGINRKGQRVEVGVQL